MMKKILQAIVLAIGLTAAGGNAYAPHGNGGGAEHVGHMGQRMMDDFKNNEASYYHPVATVFKPIYWTSEQKQKFLDDSVELRKEMYDKCSKYKKALRNPKSTRQHLSKMEQEMISLRDKIYDNVPPIQRAEQKQ